MKKQICESHDLNPPFDEPLEAWAPFIEGLKKRVAMLNGDKAKLRLCTDEGGGYEFFLLYEREEMQWEKEIREEMEAECIRTEKARQDRLRAEKEKRIALLREEIKKLGG